MEFIERLKAVLKAYRDGAHQDLLDDLLPVLSEFIQKQTIHRTQLPRMEVRDLEDLLTVVRELKDNYENLNPKTGQHMIRIDELKQMEYKLTEEILNHKI